MQLLKFIKQQFIATPPLIATVWELPAQLGRVRCVHDFAMLCCANSSIWPFLSFLRNLKRPKNSTNWLSFWLFIWLILDALRISLKTVCLILVSYISCQGNKEYSHSPQFNKTSLRQCIFWHIIWSHNLVKPYKLFPYDILLLVWSYL